MPDQTPLDDFKAVFYKDADGEPTEPPTPRVPAPNRAQGTSANGRTPTPEELADADKAAFADAIRYATNRTCIPGGWSNLDEAHARSYGN